MLDLEGGRIYWAIHSKHGNKELGVVEETKNGTIFFRTIKDINSGKSSTVVSAMNIKNVDDVYEKDTFSNIEHIANFALDSKDNEWLKELVEKSKKKKEIS